MSKGDYPKPWVTDGAIEHLKSGWAKLFHGGGECGHYWTEDTRTMEATIAEGGRVRWYRSACGLFGLTRPRAPALRVGSYPKCARCMKRVAAS